MKQLAATAAILLLLSACGNEAEVAATSTMDMREPVAIRYVGAPELPVRDQPNDSAAVIATYQNAEAVSVLAEQGEWAEIRVGDRAGWVRAADLSSAEERQQEEENPEPKFRVMPLPVTSPGASGEIYIEADVNTAGEVTGTRLISNTTGSPALAAQNEAALKQAKFHPIVQNNERRPFKYYHRVTY